MQLVFFNHRFDQLRLRPLKHGELSIELGDLSGGTSSFRSDAGKVTFKGLRHQGGKLTHEDAHARP